MDFAGVYEVKDLHHHKGIEDEGCMPRVNICFIKDVLVIDLAIYF